VGISSLISRRLGERRFKEANAAASHGFLIAAFNWILFAAFGLFFSASFVKLFSGDAEIVGMAAAYCGIVTVGSLFGFTQLSAERILQASGNMLFPMIFGIVGAVVNIALDPVLIFGLFGAPRMGVMGAALATVIGQALAMSVGLVMLFCFKHDVRVRLRGFRPRGRIIRDIYAVGAPSIAMMAMNSVAISGMNAILIRFSTAAVAVLGAYFRLQSLIFMPIFGLNQGALPIIGYNYGAKNRKRLLKAFRISVTTAVAIMAVGVVIFQIFPVQILRLFSASPEMMSVGTDALRVISLCFIPSGFIIVSSTLFQGLGHGMLSLFVTLLRQILLVLPLAWLLSTFFGLHYVWYSYPLAEVFTLALTVLFVKRVYDKEIRRL
jgi:putative MATE family efflux protein